MLEFSVTIITYFWELLVLKDIQIISNKFINEDFIYDPYYSTIWIFYLFIYIYCAIFAFQKKYPKFQKPFNKIVPSIHYYLDLRLPYKDKKLKFIK